MFLTMFHFVASGKLLSVILKIFNMFKWVAMVILSGNDTPAQTLKYNTVLISITNMS
jgi:hypothetical protein